MHSSDSLKDLPARRKLLGGMVSTAALMGLNTVASASPAPDAGAPEPPSFPEELIAQARLRSYKTRRSSSWDRTGGNGDSVRLGPGSAGMLLEVPIGDFFGLGLGEYFTYQSALLAVSPNKAPNAHFQMPFSSAARLTLTNEGKAPTNSLYFAVDYVILPTLPADVGRFHAQYRHAAPNKGWTDNWQHNWDDPVGDKKNLDGAGNYVFLEATGRGHFVGVTQAVVQNQVGWFGEGDDMIFIDGDKLPTINGTGTEDYFNGAWDFGGQPFAYQHNGGPPIVNPEQLGGFFCLYRWHLESPITFEKSIRVTIEHGHANHRSDSFYSTAYWYQTEPHAAFPALPSPADRVPKVFRVGGPGAAAAS